LTTRVPQSKERRIRLGKCIIESTAATEEKLVHPDVPAEIPGVLLESDGPEEVVQPTPVPGA